jgi:hydroxymethylpyrimidine/phosphomethylpyrimidine kinase
MPATAPIVLTIAGFDPCSGAGVTADIKTIAAHECYGVSCITALTVQSTRGVLGVAPVDPQLISDTLREITTDLEIAAVHIGMLGTAGAVQAVADFLATAKPPHIVLDPIIKSTSGTFLLDEPGVELLTERLLPLAEVITPNLAEAGTLTGMTVSGLEQMREAANRLHSLGASNVVVTGGDLEKATDLLSYKTSRGFERETFRAQRQRSRSTHGTGCAFSTSIACHLAFNRGLPEAVLLAKAFVSSAIANAQPIGHGNGPLHHLYRMNQQRRLSATPTEAEALSSRN